MANLPNHNEPQTLLCVPQAGPGASRPGHHGAVAPRTGPTRGEGRHMSPRSRGLSSAPAQPCAPSPASAASAAAVSPGPTSPQRRSQRRPLPDQRGPWARRLAGLRARLPTSDRQVRRRLGATARSPDPPISPAPRLSSDWSGQNRGQHSPPLPALSGQGHCFGRSQISLYRDESFGGLPGPTP